jgi:hypothetical protein
LTAQDDHVTPASEYRPTVVAGRYRVTGVLAQAEGGDVVEGHDVRQDRDVILKRIRRPDQNATTRLRTVHRLLSGLRHPAVMDVLDIHEGKLDSWIVSARAEGEDLTSWWSRLPLGPAARFEERWAFAGPLLRTLLDGLEAMHRSGVAHLDIKPSNIRVDALGSGVMVDFGFGHAMGELELEDETEESLDAFLGYLAPELVDGLMVSRKADQWSLGAVLYLLLTGKRPLAGRSTAEVEASYDKGKVQRPKDWLPDIPDDVEAIVLKMLSWDPDQRFESVGSVRMALGELLTPPPEQPFMFWSVAAPPLVGREPFVSFFRRRLRDLERGTGSLVLLVAPPGAGKSRLLDAWSTLTELGSDATVHFASCRPGWPRAALEGWFHPPLGDINLPPPKDIVEQALDALEGPVVVLLDALEEVDAVTWARVHRVAGAAAEGKRPLLVVLAARALPDLAPRVSPDSPRFFNVELPPLTPAAVAELLHPPSSDLEDIQLRDGAAESYCDEGRGLPGKLIAVLLEDQAAGRLVRDGRRWQVRIGEGLDERPAPARPALYDQFLAWAMELGGLVEVEALLTCLAFKRRVIVECLRFGAHNDDLTFRWLDDRWWVRAAEGSVSKTVQVYSTPQTHERVARWLEANDDLHGLTAERVGEHWRKAGDHQAASTAFHEAAAAEALIGNTSDARRLSGIARTLGARAGGGRKMAVPPGQSPGER